jgi:hypothetical protein
MQPFSPVVALKQDVGHLELEGPGDNFDIKLPDFTPCP